MKSHSLSKVDLAIAIACAGALGVPAQTDSIPRLEISTLLNLDIGGTRPADLSISDMPIELADAEVGATLGWSQEIQAQAILVHQDGLATLDQAFAVWNPSVIGLAFGKQTLPLGSYPSRLIHDPLLQADLETIAPSILASKEFAPAVVHLALASESRESDSGEALRSTSAVGAIDLDWRESASLRLSGKIARHQRILALGAQARLGDFLVDLEGFAADGAWTCARWGALAGLTWNATDAFAVSSRFDARQAKDLEDWNGSIALGAIRRFARIAYVGAEWLQDLDSDGILTLRVGLEAPLAIP